MKLRKLLLAAAKRFAMARVMRSAKGELLQLVADMIDVVFVVLPVGSRSDPAKIVKRGP